MTTTQTKLAERRKAERHGPSLRISWRMLGNRHFRFGTAALKDIGTDGMALQVDQSCPKGTVIIVQFAEVPEPFAAPMLLKAEWSRELQATEPEAQAYLVGCSFTSPLLEKDLKVLLASVKNAAPRTASQEESPAKTPARRDPFLVGSASDKRSVHRRKGFTVPVILCRVEGSTPVEASVVDRSLKGLGIQTHRPFTRGTLLKVRPRDAHEKTLSVEVEVRNCRQKGSQWFLGCHFLHTPPANVLMLLG